MGWGGGGVRSVPPNRFQCRKRARCQTPHEDSAEEHRRGGEGRCGFFLCVKEKHPHHKPTCPPPLPPSSSSSLHL